MPLMSIRARQTGKTYILEKFAKENFKNYIYINLEKDINDIFDETINPTEIIQKIEILKKINFDVNDTLLFWMKFKSMKKL